MDEELGRVVDAVCGALFADRRFGPHWQETELLMQAFQYAADNGLIAIPDVS